MEQQQQQQQQQNAQFHHPQGSHGPHDSALSVGSSKGDDAERIRELEEEVRALAERASAASQRYADYENDIRVLEAKLRVEQRKNATPSDPTATTVAQPSAQRPGISRFNSFMSTRKASPSPINGTPPAVGGGREKELEEQLIKEQTARIAAEKRANEVSAEIEDLSATLFEQANEMVATERKQNSALKTQLQLLEEQQRSLDGGLGAEDTTALQRENERLKEKLKRLEEREGQRQKRLQRLEEANRRIERVRTILKPP